MANEIKLPELGEGVTEGELVKWLVKPGDSVKADQPIAEVLTDKATVEVPSPTAGTVQETKFKPGDVVKVGSTMMTLNGTGGATKPVSTPAPAPAATPATNSKIAAPTASSSSNSAITQDVKLPELGEGVT